MLAQSHDSEASSLCGVDGSKAALGVNVACIPFAETRMVPDIAPSILVEIVKTPAVIVKPLMSLLNSITMIVFIGIPIAPLAGVTDAPVGTGKYTPGAVVKVDVMGGVIGLTPLRSNTPLTSRV
jgi:hypothetical protein